MYKQCSHCPRKSSNPKDDGWSKVEFCGLNVPETWICPQDLARTYKRDAKRANQLWKKEMEESSKLRDQINFISKVLIISVITSVLITNICTYLICKG